MTASELQAALGTIGWTQKTLAVRSGVSPGTAFYWTQGNVPVPDAVAVYLRTIMAFLSALPQPSGRAVSIASVRRDNRRSGKSRGGFANADEDRPADDQWRD